ncbi:hypothetical protein [Arthrobacter glacialis]|uniref:hypothetical protein n=1 Tax=Arthrobacter glacialis TaxID=1664 RepID=UPI000CD499FE|nr:hypothetical protein [Arthrobacter glacialis]POH60144.1 hypothetical protein CVS28_04145 [Arthrobacter glacialis]
MKFGIKLGVPLAALALAASGLLAISGPTVAADAGDPVNLYGANTALLTSTMDTVGTATTYYVDCAATTNGVGTKASPYDGVRNMNLTAVLKPGDAVAFKRGSSCVGQVHAQYSGTAAAPITYGSYGVGANARIEANGNETAFWVKDSEYVTVQDLELSAMGDGKSARRGVWVQATNTGDRHGITLQRLNIHDVRGQMPSTMGGALPAGKYSGASGGIVVEALGTTTATEFPDLLIQNNTIVNVDREGIYLWSNWCMRPELVAFWSGQLCTAPWHPITGSVIRNNVLRSIGGDGIAPMTAQDTLVEYNTLEGFHLRSGGYNAGMWSANSVDVTFQHNDTSRGHSQLDGMSYDVDHSSQGMLFQYNRSHDNEGGFFLICPYGNNMPGEAKDFTIRYNLSVNDHYTSFWVCNSGAKNGQIYNNTIFIPQTTIAGVTNHGVVKTIGNAAPGSIVLNFTNNIFTRQNTSVPVYWASSSQATITGSNNLFNNVTPLPGATSSLLTAPQLSLPSDAPANASVFKPNTNSPVLGAGKVIPGAPERDFFGNKITGNPSVGFSQLAIGQVDPTTPATTAPATTAPATTVPPTTAPATTTPATTAPATTTAPKPSNSPVASPSSTPTSSAAGTLSTATVTPGGELTITGRNFKPGTSASFTLHSDPILLGAAKVADDGTVTLRTTLPANVPAGSHTVVIAGTSAEGRSVQVSLALTVAGGSQPGVTTAAGTSTTAAAAGGLASTGVSGTLIGGFALLLVIGGGVLFAATRRRSANH